MAEYIEREAVLNLIEKEKFEATELCVPTECKKDFKAGLYRAEKIIKQVRTADVVEVCRCKDCKYFNKDRNECFMHSEEDYIFSPETFDFCSYGERKENE